MLHAFVMKSMRYTGGYFWGSDNYSTPLEAKEKLRDVDKSVSVQGPYGSGRFLE